MTAVTVRRLLVDCAIPRNHPNAMAVRTRLDDAAARLPDALAQLLAPLSRAGDEVIVLKRLELTFDLDTSLAPADLAEAWAARIAAAVARSIAPESPVSMLRFADEAHYLARFLADSTAARATATWYYRRWYGLDALPLSAQLRTALVDDPARGIAALATLSRSELIAVLTALGPREAHRVVEAVLAHSGESDGDAAARVLATAVPAWLPIASALPSAWQAALALVAQTHVALQPGELHPALRIAAALAATCAAGQVPGSPLAPRSPPVALLVAPPVEPLLALRAEARRALLAAAGHSESVSRSEVPAGWYTRLGGLLLLLPRIADLRLDDVFGADTGCARLAVLAHAAGSAQRAEVLRDPLWRRLCGAPDDVDVAEWIETAGVADRLAAHIWARAAVRARRVHLIPTRHGQPLLIVSAEPDGDWLAIVPLTSALRAGLRRSRSVELDGLELGSRIAHAHARAAAHALAWLVPEAASVAQLTFAAAAQQVLRAFARRLPGFAASSLPFLHESFLDFDATVLEADGTFHCRLGRARLAAVFGLTGALRGRMSIGGGRALELYSEG